MWLYELQQQVDEWAKQFKVPYWKPLEILARLTEETGELAREVNHRFGPKKKKPDEKPEDIGNEICDIVVTLVCLANSQGINLDEAWRATVDKLYKRDNARFEKKEE
mgnify:CR=1 FL=1